ncbi:MAG TPA: oligosaccharide flippase family protein [Polyangiaceae bacterium]|nr:oligosaccharide flippase family protein [Polyangiaceae bacterium]
MTTPLQEVNPSVVAAAPLADEPELESTPGAPQPSTTRSLVFVYVGYTFRYLYLAVLVPFYGRVLRASEYGRLLAAMSLFQIIWIITEYGLPPVGARDVAAVTSPAGRARVYGRYLAARGLLVPVGLLVGACATALSPVLRERPILGALATLNGIVVGFNLSWYFQGTLRFKTSVTLEILAFAISLPLILTLVRTPDDTWLVLLSLLIANSTSTLIQHVIAQRMLDRRAISARGGVSALRESTALFMHRGLTLAMGGSSTYLMSLFAGAAQVGWYGAAERLINAGLAFLQPANQVLVGLIYRRIGSNSTEAAAYGLIRKALLLLLAFGFAVLIGIQLVGSWAVPRILGPSFLPSVAVLKALSFVFPLAALSQVVNSYILIPLRLDRLVTTVSLVSASTTVALILTLGPRFGYMGVAMATILGYLVNVCLLLEVMRRRRLFSKIFSREA